VVLISVDGSRCGRWSISRWGRPWIYNDLIRAGLLRPRQHDVIGRYRLLNTSLFLTLKGREFPVVIHSHETLCIKQVDQRKRLALSPGLEILKTRHHPRRSSDHKREPKKAQQSTELLPMGVWSGLNQRIITSERTRIGSR